MPSVVNAASKGHLPVVLYLLTKQGANPVARNNWGETAYDVAAAVFEVWICEVLQKAEAERWRYTTVPYNPLAVHTTVPLILYEYQCLDMRLKTLAVSGGKPKFSPFGLGKPGRQPQFELKLPSPDEETGALLVPSSRSDDQRPLQTAPYTVCKPSHAGNAIPEATEKSHFWLSQWTLDITPPGVDAGLGWQYAPAFDTADEEWTAEPPPQLQRLLSGSGFMTAGLTASTRTYNHVANTGSSASSSRSAHGQIWVRRRRWVRVMRRRPDIPPLPFMQPDGAMYHVATDGTLIPSIGEVEASPGDLDGQELGTMPPNPLSSAQDYVARARYLVGNHSYDTEIDSGELSAKEARRIIAKLERATTELRQGILGDDNLERRTQAEVLLNAYGRELERRRLSASAQGLIMSQSDDDPDDDDDDDEKEFYYPGGSTSEKVRATAAGTASADHRTSVSRTPSDLTPHLLQATEFRVPTCEAPQKMVTSGWQPTPQPIYARWERDEDVTICNDCRRRFTFILRRHCRKCGRIFCDRCSSRRAPLDATDIVYDPAFTETITPGSLQRVCSSCFSELNASVPARYQSSGVVEDAVDNSRLTAPSSLTRQASNSQLSDLAECPVCGASLADLGLPADQEAHVKGCLDGDPGPSAPQSPRYLVYRLPAESALLGVECVICFEEFTKGSLVARLSCLCSFHDACFVSWLKRGRNCPVHAR
ncbi:FYVE-domain-containing protein [Pisolithus marmoratus]|nr:FYVE-domain-containing protein [Pisolithus marmoratus]